MTLAPQNHYWDLNNPSDRRFIDAWELDEVLERVQGRNPKGIQRYPLTFETAIYLMAKLAKAGQLAPPEPKEE